MSLTYYLLTIWLLAWPCLLVAQSGLQTYLDKGLSTNEQLRQQDLSHRVALAALEEAKALRSIRVDALPTYTLAAGGRTIDVPVGDLLNPVYGTLNELTASSNFPQINNASELLNPNNFYDVKVRASYPLFNRDIGLNTEVKALQAEIAGLDKTIYRRELSAEIARAYLDCQQALRAVRIYEEADLLIAESIRVNRGLYQNGKVNRTAVLQSQQDSTRNAAALANAKLSVRKAGAYLNFLTNESLTAPVVTDETYQSLPDLPDISAAANQREEIQQLQQVVQLQSLSAELAQSARRPQLNLFVDVGLQDFDFVVDRGSFYVLGGVSLSLNLYDGGSTKAKVAQAELERERTLSQQTYVADQIQLAAFTTQQTLLSQFNTHASEVAEAEVNERVYREMFRLYREGTVNYIALADARNDWTTAKLQRAITLFQAWNTWYALRRILAQ